MALTDSRPPATASSILDEVVNRRVENQASGICVRKGCGEPAEDDSDYCERCREAQREYQRDYMRRKRQEWDAAGACTRCGDPKRARGSRWCVGCQSGESRVPHQVVKSHVENHAARIAARIIPWENSPTNTNRARLRGGKMGRPSLAVQDGVDLADVKRLVVAMEEGLQYADSDEVKMAPRIQREEVKRRAMNHGYRAVGFLFTVFRRHDPKIVAEVLQIVAAHAEDGE